MTCGAMAIPRCCFSRNDTAHDLAKTSVTFILTTTILKVVCCAFRSYQGRISNLPCYLTKGRSLAMNTAVQLAIFVLVTALLTGCYSKREAANIEFAAKRAKERSEGLDRLFPAYPEVGMSYLSFDFSHGYQVTFYETESRSWLWYPGNSEAIPADWKKEGDKVCWRYPTNSYNPSTKELGGEYSCSSRISSLRTKVGILSGDVYDLAKGTIPYRRVKCDSPDEFEIHSQYATYVPVKDCRSRKK